MHWAAERIFKEILAGNFPNLMKTFQYTNTASSTNPKHKKPEENDTKAYYS